MKGDDLRPATTSGPGSTAGCPAKTHALHRGSSCASRALPRKSATSGSGSDPRQAAHGKERTWGEAPQAGKYRAITGSVLNDG